MSSRQLTRISVGGGKGGTGKSLVALNLAVSAARLGMRTVLVDADLGAANLHTMLGIEKVGPTLQGLVDKRIASLEEACVPTAEPRLFLVPGVGAVVGGANPLHAQKLKVLRHVQALDADVIVVDVGAGVSFNALDFFEVGDLRLVVTTPQLTSIQNAYSFLKGAVHRAIRGSGDERELLARASDPSATTERIAHVIARVESEDPARGARIRATLRAFGAGIVANQVEPGQSHHVAHALSRMFRDFLALDAPVLAQLPVSAALHRSVGRRVPVTIASPRDAISSAFAALATRLLSIDARALRDARGAEDAEPVGLSDPDAGEIRVRPGKDGGPDEVVQSYTRREERALVGLGARVRIEGSSEWWEGRIVDLSPHGACVLVGALELRPGDVVEVRVRHPEPAVLRGEVRHRNGSRAGLQLDEASVPASRELLASVQRDPRTQAAL